MAATVYNSLFLRNLVLRSTISRDPANDSFPGAEDPNLCTEPVLSTSTINEAKIYNVYGVGGHGNQLLCRYIVHNRDLDRANSSK